jgi:AAA ATPase domain
MEQDTTQGEATETAAMPPPFGATEPQHEAHPFAWKNLTGAQQSAAAQLFSLLAGILEEKPAEHEVSPGVFPSVEPVVRTRRNNNVLLIDGKRGSGKTSLLATVLRELCGLPQVGNQNNEGLNFAGTKRILPVAFVDLHPLPASANLLLHLVGALEEVVSEIDEARRPPGGWRGPDEPPWKASGAAASEVRDRWLDLYRVAASSWDGNLERRAANLDAEFYAMELAQAESDRRRLTVIFQRFIDVLCREVKMASKQRIGRFDTSLADKDPLFLIAIDDADLAPGRSTDLLGLLRKLWHPRVAFLLTGDSDLFLALLRQHFLGSILRPLAQLEVSARQIQAQEEAARSLILATSTLERIIPPGHRCVIAELTEQAKLERLCPALRLLKVPVPKPFSPLTLYEYFENENYASAALPSQIRSLNALERQIKALVFEHTSSAGTGSAGLSSPTHSAEGHRVARFMSSLWEHLLEREPLLGEHRHALRQVIRLNEAGGLIVEKGTVACALSSRRLRSRSEGGWTLSVMSNHSLTVTVNRPTSALPLPDPLKGAFKVAVDLVADVESFQFPQGSPVPDGYQVELVTAKWDAMPVSGMRRGFIWPLPDWEDCLSFSILTRAWRKTVALQPRANDLDWLARAFLSLTLAVAETRQADGVVHEWEALADKVVALTLAPGNGAPERPHRNASWAVQRAGLLASPESGLSVEVAGKWLSTLREAFARRRKAKPQRAWEEIRTDLQWWARCEHVRRRWSDDEPVLDSTVRSILARIDTAAEGHPWLSQVGPAATSLEPPSARGGRS